MASNDHTGQLSRVYGDETWRVYAVLDESLAPAGPDSLYDLAGDFLTAASRVLDAGCRDAAHLIRLVQLHGATGVGVDPVEVHIERARAAVTDAGLADRIQLFVGVMEKLPFPEEHFDFICAATSSNRSVTSLARSRSRSACSGRADTCSSTRRSPPSGSRVTKPR